MEKWRGSVQGDTVGDQLIISFQKEAPHVRGGSSKGRRTLVRAGTPPKPYVLCLLQ